ncbi:UNVERIFIED_CONTAM: Retrovirus-related Pol polyprotein from type-2 retrotransposable element R2DM [Sesamum calycinum]|uniref:Retrovirus-related Pol polyprotein from type-2 retrotransposable element R2DM n=1 Tax=Sesamum calycinum TaxID=2727403 RepID=A0AAW2J659_9LAMI
MENVIEGGPWLVQGQPIVLQCWEPGMSLRRQKHTRIPVWVRLKHLPMEYWTEEGLSTVASGVGTPLYTDKITTDCSRLDYARVCVMLDYNSTLPKHLVVMHPMLRDGKEFPTRIDVEYEWLPQRCKQCCSLGHIAQACPENKKGSTWSPSHGLCEETEYNIGEYANSVLEINGDDDRISSGPNASSPQLADNISEEPWLVLGDFNAVIDDSEVNGRAADTTASMTEFRNCIMTTGLIHLPFTGCPYSWHNCSEGSRSLWKRLDRIIWQHKIPGTAMYEVVHKLKALKTTFRQQRKAIGNLSENVKLAKDFLDKAQELFTTYKEDVLLHLVKCCRMVNSMRAKQRIFQITTPTGETLTDMKEVTGEFVSYFKTLLGGPRMQRNINLEFLRHHIKHSLTSDEADTICAPVTLAEIKDAAFDIAEDSAPGPDGYTAGFFKASWSVVGKEVSEAVSEFFRTGKLLKQVNATLLVLIPKVQMPSKVSDFRPIACCNVIYKIITKIIVKRMQSILHLLIDYSQNAFVPGRSISDNILLAQELLAGYNQAKLPPRCTIKVDIQKAYDSVDWDFLTAVLKLFEFPAQFIGWIEQCVSTASFSISLNGSIYGFFPGARGLRQGDPMSPYLFVLIMEIWHTLLHFRVHTVPSFQFHWKCKEQQILDLCFADDVLVFCKADIPSISVIKDTLCEFAELSGLKVNPQKPNYPFTGSTAR